MSVKRPQQLPPLAGSFVLGHHRLGAVDVLLCNIDGQVHANQDRCPHLANPLSEGELRENILTCACINQ
jgi:nitrite reductase/ring-hydroxylating ferredoxin subunit